MNRVVTFGELLLRLSPPPGEALLQSPHFTANFGGAESNVAVSLAHLGVAVSYVTALPDNPLGRAAVAALRAEGVEVRAMQIPGSRLGLYFVDLGSDSPPREPSTVYDRAHSAFAGISASSFPWAELLADAHWFHCSGITPALGGGPAEALDAALAAARTLGVRVSLDLNYRPALWGARGGDPRRVMTPLAQGVDLLIGNAASLRAMLGLDSDGAGQVAEATGARRVAVTRRVVLPEHIHEWSATLYDSATQREATSRVLRVRAVDRVGGGDSFAAALIASLLEQRPHEQALAFAVTASAHKLGVPGDWNRIDSARVERLLASPDPAWS